MLDTTKIEGYADMTAEEKVKALESLEIEDNSKLKSALNKASAEAAEFKRQLREKQTEQERAEAEARENAEKIEKELTELRRDKEVSTYKASYLALGYDDELATATAQAMVDGDTAKVFENQKLFNEKREAEFKASILNAQPSLTTGDEAKGKTLTKADIMSVANREERYRLIEENKELFTGG